MEHAFTHVHSSQDATSLQLCVVGHFHNGVFQGHGFDPLIVGPSRGQNSSLLKVCHLHTL